MKINLIAIMLITFILLSGSLIEAKADDDIPKIGSIYTTSISLI